MDLRATGSVTRWIRAVRVGADASGTAMRNLWQRCRVDLERVAEGIIKSRPAGRGVADHEDAALSGFHEVCMRLSVGQYPAISDRIALWKLLLKVTRNKARTQARDLARQARGGGRVLLEADLSLGTAQCVGLGGIPDPTPGPLDTLILAEAYRRRLDRLGDNSSLRSLVQKKLDGYTNEDLADAFECHTRTIERKLAILRKALGDESTP